MKNLSPAAYDVAMTPSDIFTVKYAFWMPPKISSTLPTCRNVQPNCQGCQIYQGHQDRVASLKAHDDRGCHRQLQRTYAAAPAQSQLGGQSDADDVRTHMLNHRIQ